MERFGAVDVLVNNAGIGFKMKPLLEVDIADEWDRVIAANLSGAFYCTQAAARHMVERGQKDGRCGGRIVNIASQAAKTGFPHLPAYVSSKHGMIGLTRAAAVELGTHGITVNAVCPNHVTTGLGAAQNAYFSKLTRLRAPSRRIWRTWRRRTRWAAPACRAIPRPPACGSRARRAGYVTGEALNVSGGEEMH